jgi:UDP-glucose 4-epimerase
MLAEGRAPMIHGTGEQTRDFIFVDDVVAAIMCALLSEKQLSSSEAGGPAYNISTGERTSVTMLAETLADIAGFDGSFQHSAAREGDIDHSALDPAKARGVFSWDARIPLDKGLAPTYEWFASRRG